jgi:hypothetical protein
VFRLRFAESQVPRWATRYVNTANDGSLREGLRSVVLTRGYLNKDEFLAICGWKTQRTKSRCASNDKFAIRTISRAAFAIHDESLKMDLLRTLVGVEWPTASTLLHFCDKRPDIGRLDRALWQYSKAHQPSPRHAA